MRRVRKEIEKEKGEQTRKEKHGEEGRRKVNTERERQRERDGKA